MVLSTLIIAILHLWQEQFPIYSESFHIMYPHYTAHAVIGHDSAPTPRSVNIYAVYILIFARKGSDL